MQIELERPSKKREREFLDAIQRSKKLYRNLATPPSTPDTYVKYLKQSRNSRCANFLVVLTETRDLVGVINIENIVRGYSQSAQLGYYAFLPHAGRGLMRKGLRGVISLAFRDLKLHRLEANIQPINHRSIALVQGLGFRSEGISLNYLKICGQWRDHERWALLANEWHPSQIARSSRGTRTDR